MSRDIFYNKKELKESKHKKRREECLQNVEENAGHGEGQQQQQPARYNAVKVFRG